MKKTALAPALIFGFLVTAMIGIQSVNFTMANPVIEERWDDPPVIWIYSPVNGSIVDGFLLNFTVARPARWLSTPDIKGNTQTFEGVKFWIDDNLQRSLADVDRNLTVPFSYCEYISNIGEGPHTLTVVAYATGLAWDVMGRYYGSNIATTGRAIVNFEVDNGTMAGTTLFIASASIVLAIAGIGLLAYFKKRK